MNTTTKISGSLTVLFAATLTSCAWPDPNGRWNDPVPAPGVNNTAPPIEEEEPQGCPAVGGIAFERPRPNVMFLVDRSGSMAEPGACSDPPCPSKWQQLLALGSYLDDVKGHARLGLTVFPSEGGDGCNVSAGTLVPLSEDPNVDQRILDEVSSLAPDGRTPIAQALDELGASGALDDPDRDNVIVLLTDGQPNCACNSDAACEQDAAVAAVERLVNRDVKITLDVVGFGESANVASSTLSAMAVAAGTALPGAIRHYQAETIEDLITRLYQISAGLAPCRFNLDDLPAPEDLIVHLDDTLVEPCTTTSCDSGYTYNQSEGFVELHGTSCAAIRDGQCHSVWFETR